MNSIKTLVLTVAILSAAGANATAAESTNDTTAINHKLNTLIVAKMNEIGISLNAKIVAVLKATGSGVNRNQESGVVELQSNETATVPAVKVERFEYDPEANRS